MKEYRVCFSFYSEECGEFDDVYYKVEASSPLEARRLAWDRYDEDTESRFRSCARQCGVTWGASPLDLQDYFNEQSAFCMLSFALLKNVKSANADIRNNLEQRERVEADRSYLFGYLDAINSIARGLGCRQGMLPPELYEMTDVIWTLVGYLDGQCEHEKSRELVRLFNAAREWDLPAIRSLREFFDTGCISLNNELVDFRKHFGKYGVYPIFENPDDFSLDYISRWHTAPLIGSLETLRRHPFNTEHVISGSGDYMPFNGQTLVMKYAEPRDNAAALLWTPVESEDFREIGAGCKDAFTAENLVTGERAKYRRHDFHGVLRPEFISKIDIDALKREYNPYNKEKEG